MAWASTRGVWATAEESKAPAASSPPTMTDAVIVFFKLFNPMMKSAPPELGAQLKLSAGRTEVGCYSRP
jgi:hypothetical protein